MITFLLQIFPGIKDSVQVCMAVMPMFSLFFFSFPIFVLFDAHTDMLHPVAHLGRNNDICQVWGRCHFNSEFFEVSECFLLCNIWVRPSYIVVLLNCIFILNLSNARHQFRVVFKQSRNKVIIVPFTATVGLQW